jgi:hypothetical protein
MDLRCRRAEGALWISALIGIEPLFPHAKTTFPVCQDRGKWRFPSGLTIILCHFVTFCSRFCLHVLTLQPHLGTRWALLAHTDEF